MDCLGVCRVRVWSVSGTLMALVDTKHLTQLLPGGPKDSASFAAEGAGLHGCSETITTHVLVNAQPPYARLAVTSPEC